MIRRLLVLYIISSVLVAATPATFKAPKPLLAQVRRLTDLLRDSYAVGYPDAAKAHFVKIGEGKELALVVFSIEGYGGGNNWTEYFAVFGGETNEKEEQYFSLIDVMPIGGKGWRSVNTLNAMVTRNPKGTETLIALDGLEVAGDDNMNNPSKKITINLLLKGGRLVEQKLP